MSRFCDSDNLSSWLLKNMGGSSPFGGSETASR